jgi:glycosyltransferase involved in cell wall biosynthesis
MNVLLIVDRLFVRHEQRLIERIASALLDEGLDARLIVPEAAMRSSPLGTLVPVLTYADRGLSFTTRIRAGNIARQLRKKNPNTRWDIVHAFGGQSWSLALELARLERAAFVAELWRAGLAPRAKTIAQSAADDTPCLFLAPDPSLERVAREAAPGIPLHTAPWGVPSPPSPADILGDSRGLSVVFHSSGRSKSECVSAFEGVADTIKEIDNAHLFVNLEAARRAGLWGRARTAGVLDKITLVDHIEHLRELALSADIYIAPDTIHEQRTMLLEALAQGLAVIATSPEQCSALIEDETAYIVHTHRRTQWSTKLRAVLNDHDHARTVAKGAWKHIREHRKVSTHMGAMTDAYTQLIPSAIAV